MDSTLKTSDSPFMLATLNLKRFGITVAKVHDADDRPGQPDVEPDADDVHNPDDVVQHPNGHWYSKSTTHNY
jgi:hypothetical protein